ncbi:MAG: lipopolysaccharide biosynthesis protein [Promethearchaeota archaeon]
MNNQDKNNNITKEQRTLAKNTFFSFLFSYGKFLFSLISSFIIARLITQEMWGFLILTISFINLFTYFILFFPPSLGLSFQYYIPRYIALNENSKLKTFIKNSLIIRFIFLIPIFLIIIFVFNIFFEFFQISLQNYTYLFYILSPLIVINSFDRTFNDLSRALNKFKIVFYLLLAKYFVNIGGLIFLFLFIETIALEMIAVITLLASLIAFLINIVYIFYTLKHRKMDKMEEGLTLKETFILLYKYGSILSVKTYIDSFYKDFKIQSIGFTVDTEFVTGFNLAQHYQEVSLEAVRSLNQPLTISFSGLYSKKQFSQIEKIFKVIFSYSLFLILLITGFLFFFTELFLSLIYGESYLKFSLIVKLILISTIFALPGGFFYSLLRVSDKVKFFIPISITFFFIRIPFFLLGLQFYGIEGSIIGLIFAEIIVFVLLIILIRRFFKIKLNFKKHVFPYFIFFASIVITLIFQNLFLAEFEILVLENLNLQIIRHLNFSSILVFILIYLFLIIIFKILTSDDIEKVQTFFSGDNFVHKTMRKGLNLLKKVILD